MLKPDSFDHTHHFLLTGGGGGGGGNLIGHPAENLIGHPAGNLIGQCSFDPPPRPLKVIGNVRLYRAPPQFCLPSVHLPLSVSRAHSSRSLSPVVPPERAVAAVSLSSMQLCRNCASRARSSRSLSPVVPPERAVPAVSLQLSPERAVPAVSLQLGLPSAQFPQSLSSCASRACSSRSLSPVVPPERAVPAVSLQLCLPSAQFPQSSISQLCLRRWSAPSLCEWACRVRLCGKL